MALHRPLVSVAIALALAQTSTAWAQSALKWVEVTSSDGSANVRTAPNGSVLTTLGNGTLLGLENVNGNWAQVKLHLSETQTSEFPVPAYVRASQVNCPGGIFHPCTIQGSDGSANIRDAKNLSTAILDVLVNGDAVWVLGGSDGWYRVEKFARKSDASRLEAAGYVHTSVITPSVFFGGVPYFCQLQNSIRPTATCGNTSTAMAVSAVLGRKITPDFLWNWNEEHFGYNFANSRDRFAEVARSLGATGSRDAVLTEAEMKAELDQGRILVMQGYFTNSYGHIVLITGYNDTGFVVYDPYGRWSGGYTGSGYANCSGSWAAGKGVTYSYRDMRSQSLLNPLFSVGVIARK